jgi:ketosteroid isomerase-like protein
LTDAARQDLVALTHAWDRAIAANDAEAIGACMTDDWTIVGSDGTVSHKESFLDLVRSGELSHDVMTSEDFDVRVYGDAALVVARSVSGGQYRGQAFRETERVTCVFARREGAWKCVHTHLSRLGPRPID